MKKAVNRAVIWTLLAVTAGCSSGGSGHSGSTGVGATEPAEETLRVLSPPDGATVIGDALTIEIAAPPDVSLTLANRDNAEEPLLGPFVLQAVYSETRHLACSVPLVSGQNRFIIRSRGRAGNTQSVTFQVVSEPGVSPVNLLASPRAGDQAPLDVDLRLEVDISPQDIDEVLLDIDGDGVIDETHPFHAAFTPRYDSAGRFRPQVTVRTADNVLYTNAPSEHNTVSVVAPSHIEPLVGIGDLDGPVTDIEWEGLSQQFYLLSPKQGVVWITDRDGTVDKAVPLDEISDPGGLGVDLHGNIYVTDRTGGRILRYRAANDHRLDFSDGDILGAAGSGAGEFDDPTDVAVMPLLVPPRQAFICVADRGNRRVQILRGSGDFHADFTGDEAGGLLQPTDVVAVDYRTAAVLDTGLDAVVIFDMDGHEISRWPVRSDTTRGADLSFHDATGEFVAAGRADSSIRVFDRDGALQRKVTVPGEAAAAVLDSAQEGLRLLVSTSIPEEMAFLSLAADVDLTERAAR